MFEQKYDWTKLGKHFPGGIDLNDLKYEPAVYSRPAAMLSWKNAENGVEMAFATNGQQANWTFTHETALYIMNKNEAAVEKLYLCIFFWNDFVFRCVFSAQEEIEDPFKELPEGGKMLVGKPQKTEVSAVENDQEIILATKEITVKIAKENGRVQAFYNDGTPYFSECRYTYCPADVIDTSFAKLENECGCFEALDLSADEVIYGLGERFDSFTRNGRTVDFYNKDAWGTTSRRTYVNIPFYMSTRNYGLFLNSGADMDWQIATTDIGVLQFAVQEAQMDYFVIAGKCPADILRRYSELTGFSAMPPLWSFGLWMSRNSYTSWDVVWDIAKQARENDIPCDVLHLDTAWFKKDWDCDLLYSKERFPDPEKNIRALQKEGYKISLWQYNFIPPNADNTHYQEAVQNGYLATDASGKPFQLPDGLRGPWTKEVVVDFTNPEAAAWYAQKVRDRIGEGAGAFKTDFGEGISTEAHFQHVDGKKYHNIYPLLYNAVIFDATKEVSGDSIVWGRSGTAGIQRYPLRWGGDSQCTFAGLAGTLRAALSIGMSGVPFFSHDIGGFIGLPDDELYVRWAQMGLFSSHSRCHGAGDTTHREPWSFSKEACDIFRKYDKLRYSLMPYIMREAEECTKTGMPMMRALYLEYPEDRNVRYIDDEYLFGRDLLIAPVLQPLAQSKTRKVYLPKGTWFDYFTKEKIVSEGKWIEREIDLATMPIYVKEGTVLEYCSADTTLANGMGEIVRTEKW